MRHKGSSNTPDNLKEAFWDLYTLKEIEKIKITEITSKAGLNRSSFYTYYTNVYDIFSQIEKDILAEILSIKDLLRDFLIDKDSNFEKFNELKSIYLKNERYLKVLFTKQDNPRFMYRLKKILKDGLIEDIKKSPKYDNNDNILFFAEFYISGIINTIVFWFTKKAETSAEEFCDVLRDIVNKGSTSKLRDYLIEEESIKTTTKSKKSSSKN